MISGATAGIAHLTEKQPLAPSDTNSQPDLEELKVEHEGLVQVILKEEEDLIKRHREHIDANVELVKKQMNMLNDVDKPGSDVETYTDELDGLLDHHMAMISGLKDQLRRFRGHLGREKKLSEQFYRQQEEELDVEMAVEDY